MPTSKVRDIPAPDVPTRTKKYIELDAATKIVIVKQEDGKFTMEVTTP